MFSIYLAGKIRRPDWREAILDHGAAALLLSSSEESALSSYCPGMCMSELHPTRERAICGVHHYTGPFYTMEEWGRRLRPARHGVHNDLAQHGGHWLATATREAIRKTTHLFAWIDSHECYGTLAEIGYASHVLSGESLWDYSDDLINIAIGVPSTMADRLEPELWFAAMMAQTDIIVADNAVKAFGIAHARWHERANWATADELRLQRELASNAELRHAEAQLSLDAFRQIAVRLDCPNPDLDALIDLRRFMHDRGWHQEQ